MSKLYMLRCVIAFVCCATSLADRASAEGEWNGFNFGVGAGAAIIERGLDIEGVRGVPNSPFFGNLSIIGQTGKSDNGWTGFATLHAGYDRQLNRFILIGAFTDFDFASSTNVNSSVIETDPEVRFTAGNPNFNPSVQLDGDFKTDEVWTLGGRIGFIASPKLLFYAFGGYSELKVSGEFTGLYSDNFSNVALPKLTLDDRLTGYTVGVGSEISIMDGLALRAEYRYSRFDGKSVRVTQEYPGFGVDNRDSLTADIDDIDQHSVRGLLVMKIGQ